VARQRIWKPHFKTRPQVDDSDESVPWNIVDACNAYDWPDGLSGTGTIAIVEFAGGWTQSDLDAYFTAAGLPVPIITDVSVDGTENAPNLPPDPGASDADVEVALDIQMAAASFSIATGRSASIRMYWTSDMSSAIRAAAADGCSVCSISWGADEALWGSQVKEDIEEACADATATGMVVLASAGDSDSGDGGPLPANVEVPASCPHVIACGGTRKTPAAEVVWNSSPGMKNGNGTGGGYSTTFPAQVWQIGAPQGPGRMVPDLSANADPRTGYEIFVHGGVVVVAGTSAVAPLYAGLFAAVGTGLGFVAPSLWQNQLCFNDITVGDNGSYRARPGPDACTGLGSPIGSKIADLLGALTR
jgi:kumamolisin